MNKKIYFRRQRRFFFGTALITYFFIHSCHNLPKAPVLSKDAENVQIIDFKADLDPNRFENLGQSECNLQDISAPLKEAGDLCYARFKNEAAEKGAHYVMVNSKESTATYGGTTVNSEKYITKLRMNGYFLKDKQK